VFGLSLEFRILYSDLDVVVTADRAMLEAASGAINLR
jgi:hypothetical protein